MIPESDARHPSLSFFLMTLNSPENYSESANIAVTGTHRPIELFTYSGTLLALGGGESYNLASFYTNFTLA